MNSNYRYLFLLLLMLSTTAFAQKQEHITYARVGDHNVLWGNLVVRELVILDKGNNAVFHNLTDSLGNLVSLNDIVYKFVKEQGGTTVNFKGNAIKVNDTTLALLKTPEVIDKYIVVEEWEYDKNKGKMVVHILMMGPEADATMQSRQKGVLNRCADKSVQPLFFMKYEELRKVLGRYKTISKPEDWAGTYSAEDYLEQRKFTSKILCVEKEMN